LPCVARPEIFPTPRLVPTHAKKPESRRPSRFRVSVGSLRSCIIRGESEVPLTRERDTRAWKGTRDVPHSDGSFRRSQKRDCLGPESPSWGKSPGYLIAQGGAVLSCEQTPGGGFVFLFGRMDISRPIAFRAPQEGSAVSRTLCVSQRPYGSARIPTPHKPNERHGRCRAHARARRRVLGQGSCAASRARGAKSARVQSRRGTLRGRAGEQSRVENPRFRVRRARLTVGRRRQGQAR